MRRIYPSVVVAGCLISIGLASFLRGAHLRIYWLPLSLVIIALITGFLVLANHHGLKTRLNRGADLCILGFAGWLFLSFFFSINPEETLTEIIRWSVLVMIYFLCAYAIRGGSLQRVFVIGLLAIILLEAIIGVYEFMTKTLLFADFFTDPTRGIYRACGTFVNSNHFAALMEMGVFLTFGLVRGVGRDTDSESEYLAQKILYTIPGAIMIMALLLSLSRGGWASFAAGLIFFVSQFLLRERPVWIRSLVLAAVVALIIGAAMYKVDLTPFSNRLESVEDLYQNRRLTEPERLSVWKSSLAMIKDHPLTGSGWGTFKSAYPSYRRDGLIYGFAYAHNDYLQIAAGAGVPALLLFLAFVYTLFRDGLKIISGEGDDFMALIMPGLLTGLFAVLVHELVDFSLMLTANAMVFFALAGMVAGRAAREDG